MKRALAVISSHYAIDLEAVSDGYMVDEENGDNVEEEIQKLIDAAEKPGVLLAQLFEDKVVPAPSDEEEGL